MKDVFTLFMKGVKKMISKIDSHPVMQYIITEESDVMSLPVKGASPGSTAIYIPGGVVYMFTGSPVGLKSEVKHNV